MPLRSMMCLLTQYAKAHILYSGAMQAVNDIIYYDETPLAHSRHGLISKLAGEGPRNDITEKSLQRAILESDRTFS